MYLSKTNYPDVILPKFIAASRTFPLAVPQVLIDALLAEQMVAPGDGDALEPVFAHGAPQHTQRSF